MEEWGYIDERDLQGWKGCCICMTCQHPVMTCLRNPWGASMNPLRLALISAAGCCSISIAVARPVIGFHGTCSFNGISEACFIRESTDQIEVTYDSDNKRVIYVKPAGGDVSVESDGKVFPATWQDDRNRGLFIFRTKNGVTEIPHRRP